MELESILVNILLLVLLINVPILTAAVTPKTFTTIEYNNNKTSVSKAHTRLITCIADKDCHAHSRCKDGNCQCEKGWLNWDDERRCSYRQSSKIIAFLLSFVFGITGLDWFLLSRKDSLYILCGILKFLLSVGCCIWSPLAARGKSGAATTAASCLSVSLTLISSIWWLIDWMRILLNSFPDGNGAPLV